MENKELLELLLKLRRAKDNTVTGITIETNNAIVKKINELIQEICK